MSHNAKDVQTRAKPPQQGVGKVGLIINVDKTKLLYVKVNNPEEITTNKNDTRPSSTSEKTKTYTKRS